MTAFADQGSPVAILFAATRWERNAILRGCKRVQRAPGSPPRWQVQSGPTHIELVETGIGLASAARAAVALHWDGPAPVFVSMGCGGALSVRLVAGDVVVADVVVDAEGARYNVDPAALKWLERCVPRAATGAILSVEAPLLDAAAKQIAGRTTKALAVDMESAAIARTAALRGARFVAVRVILDDACTSLEASSASLTALPLQAVEMRLADLAKALVFERIGGGLGGSEGR